MWSLLKFSQAEQVRDMQRQLEFAKEEAKNIEEIKNTLPMECLKPSDENCLEDDCWTLIFKLHMYINLALYVYMYFIIRLS